MSHRPQSNYFAEDGYRYGVMFNDGSVAEYWNGKTQRYHAEAYLAKVLEEHRLWREHHPSPDPNYMPDHITLARARLGQPWERI